MARKRGARLPLRWYRCSQKQADGSWRVVGKRVTWVDVVKRLGGWYVTESDDQVTFLRGSFGGRAPMSEFKLELIEFEGHGLPNSG